jgi:acyl-coenzyme A synthetase/AMP-(fatty) acid ligase
MSQTAPHFNFARDVVDDWSHRRPDALAFWWVDESGEHELKLTFRELSQRFHQAASFFHQQGIRRGDRVLVMLPRIPQWWIAMLGLIRLGAVPMPGTPLLTAKDIQYRVQTAEASAILTDAAGADRADDFSGIRIVAGGKHAGWISFDEGIEKADADFNPEPTLADDPGILYFTSGTTGFPKMVLHTQSSYGMGHRITGELWLDLKPTDVHWNLCDTGWAKAAWSSLFGPWHMGACVFAVDSRGRFDPVAALQTLARYPITTWCAPPTALRLMVRENLAAYRFPVLRHCVSAGEPLNPEVIATWQAATGLTIYEGYGQTETVVLIGNFRSRGLPIRPGSMGQPSPGFTVAVLDGSLNELPADREGELAIRVKPHRPLGMFREYWRNPAENAARFQGDWYLTGDVARRDKDGYYWFVGRADDVIKSSGYRIGPFEVESALIEHPAVMEAAVVGKADELRNQVVMAYVVLRKGCVPCDSLKHELQEHCKRVTAPYKYPREIEFVTELPKTISGKIRRVELRKMATVDHV